MRIMGIDYGDARTGLAVSDAMNILVGEACEPMGRKRSGR
mgnify:CR=1 FL=1